MDELKVDKVVTYGASGGGSSAIQFAACYPGRIHSLLLNCAATRSHKWNIPKWTDNLLSSPTISRLQIWVIENFPKAEIKAILQSESTYNAAERERVAKMIINSPEFLSVMRQLIYGRTPFGPRLTGYRNDLYLMATMGKLPLEDIQCPTLVAH